MSGNGVCNILARFSPNPQSLFSHGKKNKVFMLCFGVQFINHLYIFCVNKHLVTYFEAEITNLKQVKLHYMFYFKQSYK